MRIAFGLGLAAVLAATSALGKDRDAAELFDPAVIARNRCGRDMQRLADPAQQQLSQAPDEPKATQPPLWPGLGENTFPISSANPEAQAYFNQGIRFTYGFNHGEAIRAFRAAEEIDPTCAICAWGISANLGPNINGPMRESDNPAAVEAMRRAVRLMTPATPPKERALIEALATRYSDAKGAKRKALDAAYADAMKKAYAAFPNDPDVALAHIEAAMVASGYPWYAKRTMVPLGRIGEALAATEKMLAADPRHPGAVHYYIHLAEVPKPEKAEPYADTLAGLTPGIGHMVHMPSHLYFVLGRYKDALNANLTAIDLDAALIAAVPETSAAYKYGLYPHNINFAMSSASMSGDGALAMSLADKLEKALRPNDPARNDFYTAAAIHPRLRFETPAATLARPLPDAKQPIARDIAHYARGSAYAWQKDAKSAKAELDALAKARRSAGKSQSRRTRPDALLAVAEEVLRARITIAEGDTRAARRRLEAAIALQDEDMLFRGDPPPSDVPLRQSLAALLIRTGDATAAIPLLRQALIDTPNNAWALYALKEASARTGDTGAAAQYEKLFAKAWAGQGTPDLDRI